MKDKTDALSAASEERVRLNSFCRSVAEIQWLLVALVLLYLILTRDPAHLPFPLLASVALYFVVSLSANYLTLFDIERRLLIALHTLLMIGFITWIIYQIDGVEGPLVSLYLLAIITSSLTLGRLATLLEVTTVAACYLWLFYHLQGAQAFTSQAFSIAGAHIAMFLLMGYLTTLLAEIIYSAEGQLRKLPRLESQVSDLKERLIRVAEQSVDGFVEMDSHGRITEWNQGATIILGWPREIVMGRRVRDILVPEKHRERFDSEIDSFLTYKTSVLLNNRSEAEVLSQDGELVPIEVLIHAIEMPEQYYFAATFNEISDRKRHYSELMRRAYVDSVTGLPNRNALDERLDAVITRAETGNKSFFIIVDLDGFKEINDHYGHAAGDRLLSRVGKRIRSTVRERDLVARLGGDEFGIVLEHVEASNEQLQRIARKLVQALYAPYRLENHEVRVTASVGMAPVQGSADLQDIQRRADKAMYHAKYSGKNQFHIEEA